MKSKEKNLKKIATRIAELEKSCQHNMEKIPECMTEMNELILGLSLEDMLFIDEYILEKNLLTK